MHCYGCGSIIEPSDHACPQCEMSSPRRCPGCRGLNPGGAVFCGGCGNRLDGGRHGVAGVAEGVASRLDRQTSRSAIDGELRQVTVMFADLRGSLGVIQGSDPEQVQALLDAVVVRMVDSVERYGGTVNQVMGDGIMALFGAPVAHEDHAVRAANAALQMHDAVQRLDDTAWEALNLEPQIRVGLDSGEVLVRTARTELGLEYRAVGATTHMAARMEQLAEPGSVLLTDNTHRLGRGMLRTRSLGRQLVRGSSEPVEIHELVGMTGQTRFQANLALGVSPLVGREEPLTVVRTALGRSLSGASQTVVVSGEPGVGKSRLCYEALQAHSGAPLRMIEASAMSYGRHRPHGLLSSLLKSVLEVDAGDSAERVASKVARGVARVAADAPAIAEDAEPGLRVLVDLPIEDRRWRRLDPAQRRRRIEETMRSLLRSICAEGPTVLLFEDLHWSDDDSLTFVSGLVEQPPGEHTLLLLTHRPDLESRWAGLPDVHTCNLEGLGGDAAQQLMGALLGEADVAHLLRGVVEQTEGNPFFIEESARALLAEGLDTRTAAADGGTRFEMPATVEALLAARVDRLRNEPLELLQAAAVTGDDTPASMLQRVADLSQEEFDERMAALTRADLLYETRAFRAPMYSFKHALIQDVVYNRLLKPRLRTLHGRSADTLEALYPERLGEYVERLAEHTYRAEQWERSIGYHEMASTRALRSSASQAAWQHLSRCLEMVELLPAGRGRAERSIDLRLRAMAPLVPLGEHTRTLSLLEEAEERTEALGDAARLATIHSQQSMTLWLLAQHRRAQTVAEQAVQEAAALGDSTTELATRYYQGVIHHALGELRPAVAVLRELVREFEGPLARKRMGWAGYPSCFIATFAGSALTLLGGFEEALSILERGAALGEEIDHPYSRTMVLEELGYLQLVMGEPEEARETLELAMRLCRDNDVHVMHAPIAARLGRALIATGDAARGRAVIEDALATGTYRAAAHYGIDYLLVAKAYAQLHDGDLGGALDTARCAEEEASSHDEQAYLVCGMLAQARVLAAGTPEWQGRALLHLDATIACAAEIGMRPFEAFALEGRAAIYEGRGDADTARAEREGALAIWSELKAPARIRRLVEQLAESRAETG